MSYTQPEYKDRLFHFLFGRKENREWTLSLYNAINHTRYEDPSLIRSDRIREILYLGMHNDVSFLIYTEQNLLTEKPSCQPDMPLREMQYAGSLYEKYIKEHKLNKYGSRLIQLPVPRLVIFYNGTENQPEELILQLTDSAPEETPSPSDIEIRARMVNINYGNHTEILKNCRPLMEYAWLADQIRLKRQENTSPESAVKQAVDSLPADFLLKDFLNLHRAEVEGMLLTEYIEAQAAAIIP